MKTLLRFAFVAVALLLSPAVSADVITYYHNDLLGSPRVATNAQGAVVWRQDYWPYGERDSATVSTNKVWYTSRHQDDDTRLIYMGARHYDPVTGRFNAMDPMPFNQRSIHTFNRYVYANNNPSRYLDLNGEWATYVHKSDISSTLFRQLSAAEIKILTDQQTIIDANQGNDVQFKHALRVPNQSAREAWRLANAFVRDELTTARMLDDMGFREEALQRLGNAIHTMQDATSPAHWGFQEYDTTKGSVSNFFGHFLQEAVPFFQVNSGALSAATQRAYDLFKSRDPIPQVLIAGPQ